MHVNKKGTVSAQRITSRAEPKWSEHGTTQSAITVKAICVAHTRGRSSSEARNPRL